MTAKLLIIDPQNDFCDIPGAALPVQGAASDLLRVAKLVEQSGPKFTDIIVTLDSHPTVAIERTTFWKNADGTAVAPFTQVTLAEVQAGTYQPRKASHVTAVKAYLQDLEHNSRYKLIVWPVHCVVGTWGHNIHQPLSQALAAWEEAFQSPVMKVLKGQNMMTEQYSAVRAEVTYWDDPSTRTNTDLIFRAAPDEGEYLFVAGEASSHCVASTLRHLLPLFNEKARPRVVLLKDCMSPVQGCQELQDKFFIWAERLGVKVMSAQEAQGLL